MNPDGHNVSLPLGACAQERRRDFRPRGQTSTVTGVPGESSGVAGTLQGRPLRKVQERALSLLPPSGIPVHLPRLREERRSVPSFSE